MEKVDTFYEQGKVPTVSYLEDIFLDVTNTAPDGQTPVHLFSAIMLPIREYNSTTQKLSDTVTYHNVGLTSTELADLYWTQYSGQYLIGAGYGKTTDEDADKIKLRCRAIFRKNYGKYLKLIEMEGLVWNPLWNVDGTELRQIIENDAAEIIKDQGSVSSAERSNQTTNHNTSAYNGDTLKPEWSETVDGVTGSFTPSATTTIGEETATSTGSSVTNPTISGGSVNSNIRSIEHGELTYSVDAADTAFGTALSGGDRLHTEKYVRQGNIGVTETTKLLEDAREYIRFNIVQEFFDDINKVILIGIFGQVDQPPWWMTATQSSTTGHPDTGRTSSVINDAYDLIQSIELDEYGHVIGITSNDGVTRMSTPLTQAQYEATDPKDLPLYYVYEDDET